ncbi:MAG: DUF2490 domain-containing protein [Fuerstiella sp.]|jgi:hypothetical protein|nr:DUF2490 domain-containing protein [Fuerstiella sp.]MCP4511659.1 DUF2490 domain-containing protein [Fuerstiella sp.]MDG2128260.1 DUF2490 domain-containing protein [Fuerstiella sp.]
MVRWNVIFWVFALLLSCQITAKAQSVNDSGLWAGGFGRGDIAPDVNDRLKWWFDGHARFFDDTDGFGQSIVRPGIGYAFDERFTLWAGYGWIRTSPATAPDFDEHRIWQQVTWSQPIGCHTIGFRSRLEQRFVETGEDAGSRFRQLFSWREPISCDEKYTFVLWDEIFVHLNDTDWGANAGFDQNRLFVGCGLKRRSDSRWRTEIGYLNQHIDRGGRGNLTNHLLSVNIYRSP